MFVFDEAQKCVKVQWKGHTETRMWKAKISLGRIGFLADFCIFREHFCEGKIKFNGSGYLELNKSPIIVGKFVRICMSQCWRISKTHVTSLFIN